MAQQPPSTPLTCQFAGIAKDIAADTAPLLDVLALSTAHLRPEEAEIIRKEGQSSSLNLKKYHAVHLDDITAPLAKVESDVTEIAPLVRCAILRGWEGLFKFLPEETNSNKQEQESETEDNNNATSTGRTALLSYGQWKFPSVNTLFLSESVQLQDPAGLQALGDLLTARSFEQSYDYSNRNWKCSGGSPIHTLIIQQKSFWLMRKEFGPVARVGEFLVKLLRRLSKTNTALRRVVISCNLKDDEKLSMSDVAELYQSLPRDEGAAFLEELVIVPANQLFINPDTVLGQGSGMQIGPGQPGVWASFCSKLRHEARALMSSTRKTSEDEQRDAGGATSSWCQRLPTLVSTFWLPMLPPQIKYQFLHPKKTTTATGDGDSSGGLAHTFTSVLSLEDQEKVLRLQLPAVHYERPADRSSPPEPMLYFALHTADDDPLQALYIACPKEAALRHSLLVQGVLGTDVPPHSTKNTPESEPLEEPLVISINLSDDLMVSPESLQVVSALFQRFAMEEGSDEVAAEGKGQNRSALFYQFDNDCFQVVVQHLCTQQQAASTGGSGEMQSPSSSTSTIRAQLDTTIQLIGELLELGTFLDSLLVKQFVRHLIYFWSSPGGPWRDFLAQFEVPPIRSSAPATRRQTFSRSQGVYRNPMDSQPPSMLAHHRFEY